MDVPAVTSLLTLQAYVYQKGDNINIIVAHNYLVDRARQNLIEAALKMDNVDYILNIDSDHVYKPELLYQLIERMEKAELQMLSAKYHVRNNIKPPRAIAMCNWTGEKYVKIVPEPGEKGIQECDVVGNGFLVIKRDFAKRLYDKYKTLFKMSLYGEDAYFCELVRKEGEKVCYDADTVVGHLSLVVN